MSLESTRAAMSRYLDATHADTDVIAEDAVFTVMGTGQQAHGRDAIFGMLQYFYHVAFDATVENPRLLVTDGHAVLEADFTGKQLLDFGGIPPTGQQVRVPLCVSYDLENDRIVQARIYFEAAALLPQAAAS
ncbi:MAG: ester cyclase [Chloroflexota bacterium]